MYFADEAKIKVRSGKGGDGCISFRREKFVPKGGPSGGDGGKGGDVYIRASSKLMTLYDFRLKSSYAAERGASGEGKDKHGRSGRDLVIDVPVGTMVRYESESGEIELLADLTAHDESILVVKGGQGGKGNIHYKSSVNRTPREAQSGGEAREIQLFLELQIIADAGVIGLPNAGKSTFLSSISNAGPKVASYPFTTLNPQLGVIKDDIGNQKVIADMPGLIEGAHSGYGLGDEFLRHTARTKFLIHLLSIEDMNLNDPWSGFELVNRELKQFDRDLGKRNQVWVVNKIDLCSSETLEELKSRSKQDNLRVFFISALNRDGVRELLDYLWSVLGD